MSKQVAIIGMGRFGESVARTLAKMGHEVLIIDSDQCKIQPLIDVVTHAVQADSKDEEVLKKLGIRNFDIVVVAMGEDVQANILTTVLLKELGCPYVISKAQDYLHGKVLEKIGADKVVYPERDMGIRVAQNITHANILDYIELSNEHSIVELNAPEKFLGKTLGKLNLRAKYGVSVMAIKRNGKIVVAPGAEEEIREGDFLIIIGENKTLGKFNDE